MISCLLVPTPTLSTTEFLQNSATQQLCPPSLPGLAAAYCFEDNVLDEVGDANGQIVGNANFLSGLLNGTKAFEFDGATYVRLVWCILLCALTCPNLFSLLDFRHLHHRGRLALTQGKYELFRCGFMQRQARTYVCLLSKIRMAADTLHQFN